MAENGAAVADRILALGRGGCGRAEIAAALGVSLQDLAAMEGEAPDVSAALRDAQTAAQAWWERAQREALMGGARLNAGAWRSAMAWRFGDPGKGAVAGPPAPEPPRAIYRIPCNTRTKLRPDGTCPCAGVHDAAWFRRTARLRAWVIAGNRQSDFDDEEAGEDE